MKLGIDISSAISSCEKAHIIHRDIKPQNIFVNEFGDFKLGDFGIAKQLERTGSVHSMKGTSMYMAPEVIKGLGYDHTVDIYSLGIMLYRFMNHGRAPFYPPYPKQITPLDVDTATRKKNTGEQMPAPDEADEEQAKIILKACSYNSSERYQSAEYIKNDLLKYRLNHIEEKKEIESPLHYKEEPEAEIEKTEVLITVPEEAETEEREDTAQPAEQPQITERADITEEEPDNDNLNREAESGNKPERPASRFRPVFMIPIAVLAVLITVVMLNRKSGPGSDTVPEQTAAVPASDVTEEPQENQDVSEPENSSEQTSEIINTAAPEDSGENPGSTNERAEMIVFGSYEQDGNTSNGKEPIEWRVLAKEEDRILVISELGLAREKYNETYEETSWETCTLRQWLNSSFLNKAFSEEEQARILETTVTAEKNPDYGTDAGNDTVDRLFLLSIDEARTYFSGNDDRELEATEMMNEMEDYFVFCCNAKWPWWLRSPGYITKTATGVDLDGTLFTDGVDPGEEYAVRPALWLKVE